MNAPSLSPAVHDVDLTVLEVERAESLASLLLERPAGGRDIAAGQFGLFKSLSPGAPLLPRPISLIPDAAGLRIAFNIVAEGTRALAAAVPGERVAFVGPLGNAFDAPAEPILIVADAPHAGTMLALAVERSGSADTVLYVTDAERPHPSDDALIAAFRATGLTVLIRPRAALGEVFAGASHRYVAAGAADPTMALVQRLAPEHGMRGEAALQAAMACGLGVCQVCVHAAAGGASLLVCDGPVFALEAPAFAAAAA